MDTLMASYPKESARFFKDTRDPFANPVGATFKKGLEALFDIVTAERFDAGAAAEVLEPMVRVRTIQELKPSQALGFIPEIKTIVQKDLRKAHQTEKDASALLQRVEGNADKSLLVAFDIYMACKKQVFTLRAKQARESVGKLLIKKKLISELPDIESELLE